MTPYDKRIISSFAIALALYCVWFALVVGMSFRYFSVVVHHMNESARIKAWIADYGIPPALGVGGTVFLWFGATLLLLWLPVWVVRKRGLHDHSP